MTPARLHLTWLVLALLALIASATVAGAERRAINVPDDEFTFVVLGDSQLDEPAAFNRIIDDVVLLQPAFVVQVGDLIDGYTNDEDVVREQWDRFRAQIRPLGEIPYFPVPGNHDLYGADREPSEMLDEVYRDIWGDPNYAFTYRNARFIVLNTDERGAPRAIDDAQWTWLEHELAVSNAEHVFVFMHWPPRALSNGEALHALLTRFPVAIVFFGHFHHFHQYERDGVRYVMTNATGEMGTDFEEAGSLHHLLQVRVRDGDVSFTVIPADAILRPDFTAPEDNDGLYGLRRSMLASPSMETKDLTKEDDGWSLRLLLSNPTPQTVHAYLEWSSPDERWHIGPEPAVRVTLPAHTENKAVPFTIKKRAGTQPEGWPSCSIRAPFLTSKGNWVTVTRDFRITESQSEKD